MRRSIKHGIILFTIFGFLFVVGLETTLAQQMSTFEGSVTSIATSWPTRGIITVKGNKGDVMVFAVGHRTVYVPSRYPGVGERVKITYSLERGQNAAYTVEILPAPAPPPQKGK
jgi:hypothetical protein